MATATVPATRHGLRGRLGRVVPAVAVGAGVLGLWELVIVVFDVTEFLLPRPSRIASTLADELGVLTAAARFTLRSILGGLLIGTAAGILVALATARFSRMTEATVPLAAAVNSTPIIALAPITNQWFGVTDPLSNMTVVAVVVFFPVMINVTRGLLSVDRDHLELLRSYAASQRQVVLRARLPNALPFLFSGLKVASSLSVIAAVVAEYFGGPRQALGVFITQQAAVPRFAEAWAAVVIASAIGLTLFGLVTLLERRLMPWHASQRDAR